MYFYGSRCAVFKGQVPSTTEYACRFLERVTTAAGIHLFPFRTEKLSPPAPMVLRGRLRGRVGRRPFFLLGASRRAARSGLRPSLVSSLVSPMGLIAGQTVRLAVSC